jgi:aspartyl/asparaginyl beta-hydroxylase (cupin superfamily)
MQPLEVQALTRQALEALRRQQPHEARDTLERIAAAGLADASTHLGLAYAAAMLEDVAAAQSHADATLEIEPQNLRALMLKADLFHVAGNGPAAATFYRAALKAAPDEAQLPPDLHGVVARAKAMAARYQQELADALASSVGEGVSQSNGTSARFSQSVDLLLGRKQLYLQQPRHYYFPELPHIQFHPRERFPWLQQLEAATAAIRAELSAVLKDPSCFQPYVQRDPTRPSLSTGGMMNNADWSAFYLRKNGQVIDEHARRCPQTMAAVACVPLTVVPGRSPSVLFSLLKPGAHIPAHHGFVNTRLICHLPLIVPPGCTFRVGNDSREWVEGKAWVFDDTIEHEAWNRSDRHRVILLFEVWQPDLTPDEQQSIGKLFQAIDGHPGGSGADWTI